MSYVLKDLSGPQQKLLTQKLHHNTKGDSKFYQQLSSELMFNPNISLLPIRASSLHDLLLSQAADEPDFGIDNNIEHPDADPKGDRTFMGGVAGPNSRGFRHMYFGGWKLDHPIRTFQIPTRALGQAPERTLLIAEKARLLIRSGELFWGFRLLAWSMHLLQDLSQPFHSTQIPSLKMPAWGAIFSWPPSQIFGKLVSESTRIVSNYHYAYEAYTFRQLSSPDTNFLKTCLTDAKSVSKIQFDPKRNTPFELAQAVAQDSVTIAPEVGAASIDFFGEDLKKPEFDIPNQKGSLNYDSLSTLTEHTQSRERLEKATCRALANGVMASRYLLLWALEN